MNSLEHVLRGHQYLELADERIMAAPDMATHEGFGRDWIRFEYAYIGTLAQLAEAHFVAARSGEVA